MNITELRQLVDAAPVMKPGDAPRYLLRTVAQLAGDPSPPWLIVDLLPARGLAVLYGEPGSGKSFLALDIAAHLARKRGWAGRRTRRAQVVYVALEGHLKHRLDAYKKRHGLTDADLADLFTVRGQPLDLLQKDTVPTLIAEIRRQLGERQADLVIVIDTLARAMPGGNENASDDMGRIIAACAEIERQLGALVLLIHHAGKDAARGARGWSGLRGAADVEIVCERDGDRRWATFAKVKDGHDGHALEFVLEVIDLGPRSEIDPDAEPGERITSCVAVVTDANTPPRQAQAKAAARLGKHQRLLFEAIRTSGPWTRAKCYEFMAQAGVGKNRTHEAIDALLARGLVTDLAPVGLSANR